MVARKRRVLPQLSALEMSVMEVLWKQGPLAADDVRGKLGVRPALSNSTVRTILGRLEAKSHVVRKADGRRFVYKAIEQRSGVAAAAVKRIVDGICGGAVDSLLFGMLENDVLSKDELDAVVARIEAAEREREKMR